MGSHHPPPLEAFQQLWYNSVDQVATVVFWYGTSVQQKYVFPDGCYWCRTCPEATPQGFAGQYDGSGAEFNNNYKQAALKYPGTITKESSIYPDSDYVGP